jgi:predicted dinucleotide-binding enzyme
MREPGVIMKIGIIGSGKVGSVLTRRLRALGHDVTVANSRGPQSLSGLTQETGAGAATVESTAKNSDVVVLAIPTAAVTTLPLNAFSGKLIVDANNYSEARDGEITDIADKALASSRWTADHFPDARVVKAFNTIIADHLLRNGRPAGDDDRIALPVAGDDQSAKRTVMGIVEELGFDPVDAGTLDESLRQQPGTPVHGSDHDVANVKRDLAAARP